MSHCQLIKLKEITLQFKKIIVLQTPKYDLGTSSGKKAYYIPVEVLYFVHLTIN